MVVESPGLGVNDYETAVVVWIPGSGLQEGARGCAVLTMVLPCGIGTGKGF